MRWSELIAFLVEALFAVSANVLQALNLNFDSRLHNQRILMLSPLLQVILLLNLLIAMMTEAYEENKERAESVCCFSLCSLPIIFAPWICSYARMSMSTIL